MPPAVVRPPIVVQAPPPRRPGVASGLWARRAVTLPLVAGAACSPWIPLDHRAALGVGLAGGATAAVGNLRRRRGRALHQRRIRTHALRQGVLADRYPIDEPLPGSEGVFRLGVTTDPGPRDDYELQWRPWDGDPPHILFAGSTGSGKSEAGRLVVATALRDGWDVEIIDLKGSTEYHPLPVHDTPQAARDCLARLIAEIRRRGELLRDVVNPVLGADGRVKDGRHRNFRDVPEEVRDGLRPRLVLLDEAALLRLPGTADERDRKAGERAVMFLQAATALTRSLGIHLAILVQRPDADLLPGFLRNNVQARVLFGGNDEEAQRMTVGPAAMTQGLVESDPSDRPPGRCVAADVGGPGARLAHGYLLHEAALLRDLDGAGPAAAPADADARGGPPLTVSVDDPPRSGSPTSGGPPPHGSVAAGSRRGVATFGGPPGAPAASLPSGGSPPSPASPSLPVRLRAPIARACLRASAWRLLIAAGRPNTAPRPHGLRDRVLERRPSRCAACGTTVGPFDVEHWRPRRAGGSDRLRNLWVCCTRCHAAKSSEEALVFAWRGRLDPRACARVPAWAWAAAGASALGLIMFGGLLGAIVAGLLVIQAWFVFRDPRGVDGLATLDARLEGAYGGVIGQASRARTTVIAGTRAYRLIIGALGVAYLAGIAVRWWW
ncbi:MAG: FtsK/SpoIIIE domain-containing protein [Thermoleophilia bacterium]